MKLRLCFLLIPIFCSTTYAHSDKPVAGNQMVEMEGRGFYITSPSALFDGSKTLTFTAPVIDWLGDMKQEHLNSLAGIDLSDLPSFANTLDKGFKNSPILSAIELTFKQDNRQQTLTIHDQVTHVSSSNGNMRFTFKKPLTSIPGQTLQQVTFVFKTWHLPTVDLGRYPMHAVCCDCSGGCAALWILFAWCNTCVAVMGGKDCCTICNMPAVSGKTCP